MAKRRQRGGGCCVKWVTKCTVRRIGKKRTWPMHGLLLANHERPLFMHGIDLRSK